MQITEKLLTPNAYSRPQTRLNKVTHIVIHWVGNANTSAMANRNYFESLRTKKSFASSHYIIGLEGEVIQCVPENEVAYHAKRANSYSIGIECCHPDWGGQFNAQTYASLIELCKDLCNRYKLDPKIALLRHYDVTRKECPKYYVLHQDAWEKIKRDVATGASEEEEDKDLDAAVRKIILSGVQINYNSWKRADLIKLNNVPALLNKLGGVNALVAKQVIGRKQTWLTGAYNVQHVRSLLIKYAESLS